MNSGNVVINEVADGTHLVEPIDVMIPVIYKSGHFESHFILPCGSICNMGRVSYIYDSSEIKLVCIQTDSNYNDGQSTFKTKHYELFTQNKMELLVPVKPVNSATYFIKILKEFAL